jgi:flagellar protein FliS
MYANAANPINTYQQNNINTASQGKLILMLYEGAVKFCRLAEMAIDEKNVEKRHNNLRKAKNIIQELALTLNREVEFSEKLGALYAYMERQLISANINNDKNKINEVREILEELKDAWEQIVN